MNKYIIEKSTREEVDFIDSKIIEYNSKKVAFTQESPFIGINRTIKGEKGNIVAGISSILYCWKCLHVDILWVDEKYQRSGLGSKLLNEVEKVAKQKGCCLVELDTFDFQAKDFYIKHGYEVFGVLDHCPEGHKRYYLKKSL